MSYSDNNGRLERPLAAFQVITDTHVTDKPDHVYNRNFERALKDIIDNADRSSGIMHVGDLTDHGFIEEYRELIRIIGENSEGLPEIYFTVGNHDVALGDWPARLRNFTAYTGMKGAYHDHWIDGFHYIFLGTEQGLEKFCHLTEEQLTWLAAKLGEDASADKPVFVFLHQPLKNTVAGSLESQNWYGVVQDEDLRNLLHRFPQAIMFSGHTHWHLEAGHTMVDGMGRTATMFNAASVAYLWIDEDAHLDGSQGYYVEIYPDKVLVRGRDFVTGSWIESAQFQVNYPVRIKV
ncbi:metallophosphoesterase [Paenibacillus sp. sptzw28]|uniref:metallophosphoesterase family protein n=1 Tax=Paenibacillus sp. sptzw28 TaxID=715179 RepID=UPI001C6F0990|nr:metallophosphoesterase [Paenibacillus sp. sptzw28]QYR20967.1 metallophosphoesterase [Paenibacillus sp. sptzw28]